PALRHRRPRHPHPALADGDPALPRADAERRQPRPGRVQPHGRQRAGAGVRGDRDGDRRLRGGRRPRPDRRDLPPPPAAQRRRPAGAARMSATAWAWLVLLFPLLGSIAIALGYKALPQKAAGAIGTAAIGLAFACGVAALISLLGD